MTDKSLRDLRMSGSSSAPKAPKVEFPCDYPIKIVGDAVHDFQATVIDVVEAHAPGFDRESVSVVDSRNGKFQSVRVTITATGNDQLRALFASLKATGRVHMVL
ncbi:DUF493 domain-containing protein [Halomonas sp. McH1-25]|uniref:HP0495 family protein n=1 Tax=unclassified Halomonas TaxID=2609666 RepID=UPI001EF5CA33|nr:MULTISPECIES: DUF493 domain-containing protein [unclassified Halomonas]MCG7599099.1 DUF493 domain-containing protein [Halomonas sp. McH1-25]MCP1342344.1 DUF493 domain-containing protein [Halomonas sp. FL8]MCP1360402.1 DUF493 domain-containing protein [Halomonas sp. BBD45]